MTLHAHSAASVLLVAVTLIAAGWDLYVRRVPLAVNALGLVGLPLWAFSQSTPTRACIAVAFGFLGGVVGFAIPVLLERRIGSIGGGDIALLTAAGVIVGPLEVMWLAVVAWLIFAFGYGRRRISAPAAPAVFFAALLLVGIRSI